MAKRNKVPLPHLEIQENLVTEEKEVKTAGLKELFKSRILLIRSLIIFFNWYVKLTFYLDLSINVPVFVLEVFTKLRVVQLKGYKCGTPINSATYHSWKPAYFIVQHAHMRLYQMFNNFLFVDFHFLYTHENYRSTVLYNQKYVKNFTVFLILF